MHVPLEASLRYALVWAPDPWPQRQCVAAYRLCSASGALLLDLSAQAARQAELRLNVVLLGPVSAHALACPAQGWVTTSWPRQHTDYIYSNHVHAELTLTLVG